MKILNVVTQKGGTGKSETVKNIAYGLSKKGLKTLVVDLDPQANTTSTLLKLNKRSDKQFLDGLKRLYDFATYDKNKVTGLEGIDVIHKCMKKDTTDYDASDVLLNPSLINEAIKQTEHKNLYILPASSKLIETDMQLKTNLFPTKLRDAFEQLTNNYDVCVIDNSPFINAITINGLNACKTEGDLIIVPIKIDEAGLEGVDVTLQQMTDLLKYVPELAFDFKLLITMRNRTKIEADVEETLRYMFPERCFVSTIRYQSKPIVKASLNKKILLEAEEHLKNPDGVATDYAELVEEVFHTITS